MKSKITVLALATLGLALGGCKKEEPKQEASSSTAALTPAPAAKAKPSDLSPDEPKAPDALSPSEMGDEAESSIAPDQLENELDRLEAEITLGS